MKSSFINNICCEQSVVEDFRAKTCDLHNEIVLHWRTHTVTWVAGEYWRLCDSASGHSSNGSTGTSPKHSSAMMHCLLSLSAGLQQLGVVLLTPQKRDEITRKTLYSLVEALVDPAAKGVSETWHRSNLLFVCKMLDTWDPTWPQATGTWQTRLKYLTSDHTTEVESQFTEVLARTQMLLAFLFPSQTGDVGRAAALLRLGKPSGAQEYQPAVDVVKPSPRLGLLLV